MVSSVYDKDRRPADLRDSTLRPPPFSPGGEGNDRAEEGVESPVHAGLGDSQPNSSTSQPEQQHIVESKRIAKKVLFTSRENVDIMHELFRLGMRFPYQCNATIKRILKIYNDWFHMSERPEFLLEPDTEAAVHSSLPSIPEESKANSQNAQDEVDVNESLSSVSSVPGVVLSADAAQAGRNRSNSYRYAMLTLLPAGSSVRAGLQRNLQLFIVHSANIFLMKHSPSSEALLNEQFDMCNKVILIYRSIEALITECQDTWEVLLKVFLHVTSGLLRNVTPPDPAVKKTSLSARLAQPLCLTLIVMWIKASLIVSVPTELWNEFTSVLSSLTHWEELVKEWAKTMETLTRMMTRFVYDLDLRDLPLEREKRRRGRDKLTEATAPQYQRGISRQIMSLSEMSVNFGVHRPHQTKTVVAAPAKLDQLSEERRALARSTGSLVDATKRMRSATVSVVPKETGPRLSLARSSDSLGRSNSEGNLIDIESDNTRVKLASSEHLSTIGSNMCIEEQAKDGIRRQSQSPASSKGAISSSPPVSDCMDEAYGGAPWERQQQPEEVSESISFKQFMDSGDASSLEQPADDSMSLDKQLGIEETAALSRPRAASVSSNLEIPEDWKSSERSLASESVTGSLSEQLFTAEDTEFLRSQETLHSSNSEHRVEDEDIGKSLLCGGTVPGWTPDASVVLWRRMLGALGNVNRIPDPSVMALVYQCLCDLLHTMRKIRENQGACIDDKVIPTKPSHVPPFTIFAPWVFEAIRLPNNYKKARLLAYRILCDMTLIKHDLALSPTHVAMFLKVLHEGLSSSDADVRETLVRYCSPRVLYMPMPGVSILFNTLRSAAHQICSTNTRPNAPHEEAVRLLGGMLALPGVHCPLRALEPGSTNLVDLHATSLQRDIVQSLIIAAKKQSSVPARCVALNALGVFIYTELSGEVLRQEPPHEMFRDAIDLLLATIRFPHTEVSRSACSVLRLLSEHCTTLIELYFTEIVARIVEILCTTISANLATEKLSGDKEKKLLVELLCCLLEWTLRLPRESVLEVTHGGKSRLFNIFRVVYAAATGCSVPTPPRPSFSFEALFDELGRVDSSPRTELASSGGSSLLRGKKSASIHSVYDAVKQLDHDPVQAAAKMVLSSLVNRLGHFPMGLGASRLSSAVHEANDHLTDDLTADVFTAANVQFLVLNNNTLISLIEIPSESSKRSYTEDTDDPNHVLTSCTSICRVIVRDLSGKHSWDAHVLYGPADCRTGSFPSVSQDCDNEPTGRARCVSQIVEASEEVETKAYNVEHVPRYDSRLTPSHESDVLYRLLAHISHTSPECVLFEEPLNSPAPTAAWESNSCEQSERLLEAQLLQEHQAAVRAQALPSHQSVKLCGPEYEDKQRSVFQLSRLFINWLGLLTWDKRAKIDLLQKSDQLLRELKNLDSHVCRETHKIAVLYVAPGQEDKHSILSNTSGSTEFEQFVAGLGWEVDLESHQGFMGGLQPSASVTMPYYSSATTEVMFHVATRLPAETEEDIKRKWRHLGNDRVQIVWSEHERDYRRDLIRTAFGDVIIAIYPQNNGLCRVHIMQKPDLQKNGVLGPLFDGALIERSLLPPLVRATAINARRALCNGLPSFKSFYEDRQEAIERVVEGHKSLSTFEQFAARIFAPILPGSEVMTSSQSMEALKQRIAESDGPPAESVPPANTAAHTPARSVRGSDGDQTDNFARLMSRRLSFKKSRSSKSSLSQELPESPKHK